MLRSIFCLIVSVFLVSRTANAVQPLGPPQLQLTPPGGFPPPGMPPHGMPPGMPPHGMPPGMPPHGMPPGMPPMPPPGMPPHGMPPPGFPPPPPPGMIPLYPQPTEAPLNVHEPPIRVPVITDETDLKQITDCAFYEDNPGSCRPEGIDGGDCSACAVRTKFMPAFMSNDNVQCPGPESIDPAYVDAVEWAPRGIKTKSYKLGRKYYCIIRRRSPVQHQQEEPMYYQVSSSVARAAPAGVTLAALAAIVI